MEYATPAPPMVPPLRRGTGIPMHAEATGGGLPLDGVRDVIEAEQAASLADLDGDEVNAP